MEKKIEQILEQYDFGSPVISCEQFGVGHINWTYRVETKAGDLFVLQRINTYVFRNPEGLMRNIELITEFMPDSGDIGMFVQKVSHLDGVHKVTRDGDKCSIRYAKDSVVIDRIIGITLECGLSVSNMTRQDPSLEEIFLSLTGKELRDGKDGK